MRTRRPSALLSRLAEMYLVRETLESAALSAAAHRATDAVLEQAVREDDSHTYHRQSRVFHLGLTRPAGMLRLLHMLESAWNMTEPVQLMVHVAPDQRALLQASAEHNRRLNTAVTSLPVGTGLVAHDPTE